MKLYESTDEGDSVCLYCREDDCDLCVSVECDHRCRPLDNDDDVVD